MSVPPPFTLKKYFDVSLPTATVQPTAISKVNTGQSRIKGGFKGSDRLCKVVELSMQCCGKLRIHLRHIKHFKDL